VFWSVGLISLANLVFRGKFGYELWIGFMMLAGSGILRLRPSLETPEASDFADPWNVYVALRIECSSAECRDRG
jgi:hypothetical protein